MKQLMIESLHGSLDRPHFHYPDASWLESSLLTILRLLAKHDRKLQLLTQLYLIQCGEHPTIERRLRSQSKLCSTMITEVASSFAEVAVKLGFMHLKNQVLLTDVKRLLRRSFYKKQSWTSLEIESLLGEPSVIVDGARLMCYCYGAYDTPWYFFDFQVHLSENGSTLELRSVREPSNTIRLLNSTID